MRMFLPWPKGLGRHLYLSVATAFFVAAIPAAEASAQTLGTADAARREDAIVAARAGNYPDSLSTLEQLRNRYPDDLSLLHDYVAVLSWSGDHKSVIAIAASLTPEEAPRYAQLAVAKSARDVQRFELAALWYDAAIAANPGDTDARIGRLLTAGDARDAAVVHRLIGEIDDARSGGTSVQLAKAYALQAIGESLPALSAYDAALDEQPEQHDALRGKALVLRSMLLPTQALEIEAEHPGTLTAAEVERLKVDEAAINLRMTSRTPYLPETLYANRDRAITRIDDQLDATTQPASRTTLMLDRIVALNDANEPEAAVAAFEALPDRDSLQQGYVLVAVAKSYLQLKRPEEGLALLERAIALAPDNVDYQLARVYALLDLERYEEAYDLTQTLTASLPRVRQAPGSNVIKGNEVWMQAELVAGIAEAYGDQLDAAQKRFEALLREAPNNSDLRHELANVYRWRGWIDRSSDEYRRVLTMENENLTAELGFAHNRIDARDYPTAAATIDEVSSLHGRDPGVAQLAERWEIHNEREVDVYASSGDSSGPISGSNNYSIDARFFTAPIAYQYRVIVATHDGYAEFPEGTGRRSRLGAGLEYRSPRFAVTGIVTGSRNGGGDVGFAGEMDYRLGDFWSLSSGLERNSDRVQLRAHRLGIDADRAFIGAEFAPNELASVALGYDALDYSDGNRLKSLYADGRYRLMNRPRSKLDATGGLSFGHADTADAPYFSPTGDRSVSIGLEHEYRFFRRYERELTQTVGASTGRYDQNGFPGGSTWSMRYRIDWSLSQRLALGFGAERHGQLFDGAREHTTIGLLSVTGRF